MSIVATDSLFTIGNIRTFSTLTNLLKSLGNSSPTIILTSWLNVTLQHTVFGRNARWWKLSNEHGSKYLTSTFVTSSTKLFESSSYYFWIFFILLFRYELLGDFLILCFLGGIFSSVFRTRHYICRLILLTSAANILHLRPAFTIRLIRLCDARKGIQH